MECRRPIRLVMAFGASVNGNGERRERGVMDEKLESRPPIPTADYERLPCEGWNTLVSPRLEREAPRAKRQMIRVLSESLRAIRTSIPEPALSRIMTVPIWIEFGNGRPPGEYHHHPDGLAKLGMNPDKLNAVQVSYKMVSEIRKRQPSLVLHELAHAYHDQMLTFNYEPIERAFARACNSQLYEGVRRYNSRKFERSYALENSREFFAELSESYFGTGDFYPFTRDELEAFDAESAEVIREAWYRDAR